jgi:hypothetical protein
MEEPVAELNEAEHCWQTKVDAVAEKYPKGQLLQTLAPIGTWWVRPPPMSIDESVA